MSGIVRVLSSGGRGEEDEFAALNIPGTTLITITNYTTPEPSHLRQDNIAPDVTARSETIAKCIKYYADTNPNDTTEA